MSAPFRVEQRGDHDWQVIRDADGGDVTSWAAREIELHGPLGHRALAQMVADHLNHAAERWTALPDAAAHRRRRLDLTTPAVIGAVLIVAGALVVWFFSGAKP